jgi:hypothetical protein
VREKVMQKAFDLGKMSGQNEGDDRICLVDRIDFLPLEIFDQPGCQRAWMRQPTNQRLDVVLKKFDGLYYDEISRILGVHICLTNKVYLRIVSSWKIKSYQYPLSRDHTAERQRCI